MNPPHNIEAEAALLGAMMQQAKLIDPIADKLTADHFFEPLHGRIFTAILGQHSLGRVANPVTLKPFLEADPAMIEVGGVGYLARLTGSGAAVIGARDFADQVRELALRRLLVGGLTDTIEAAGDSNVPLSELATLADDAINAARESEGAASEY